jgi:NTP pyrophosphatase (non-canonical NTP hydrolase)
MTPKEYQKLAHNTEAPITFALAKRLVRYGRLIHATEGMSTEVGEFTDVLKKTVFYGKELDMVNLSEEIGDLMWYVALACNALKLDLEQIMETNIAKLTARYPDKFTEDSALNRDLDKERKVLDEN